MKKLITVIMVLFLVNSAIAQTTLPDQQNFYKSAPFDYVWQNVGNAGFTEGQACCPDLVFSPSGEPYVSYVDIDTTAFVTVMKFDENNWVYVGTTGFSATFGTTSLAFSPSGELYIAYTDEGNNSNITIKKFDGSSWGNVGTGIAQLGAGLSLAFSLSGEPYVAFNGLPPYPHAGVMKYDGNNWVSVGNEIFTIAQSIRLAFHSSGEPYVAFQSLLGKATVMKYDGSSWVYVGDSTGFSAGLIDIISLAFSPSGEPYVAYNEGKLLSVMKFDGNSWIYVGNAGFTAGDYYMCSLAISPSGEPYVAGCDSVTQKATVTKFDGSNWIYVGNAGFSAGSIEWPSLALSPSDGQPFIAYMDEVNSFKATVMKYDYPSGFKEPGHSQILCYPNPTSTIITVVTPAKVFLSILNTSGQQVLQKNITEPESIIDVSELKSGVYFVRITGDRNVLVKKLIKQ